MPEHKPKTINYANFMLDVFGFLSFRAQKKRMKEKIKIKEKTEFIRVFEF